MLPDRGMMGDGVAELRAIRVAVENAGYSGACEVETFSAADWWKRDSDEVFDTMVDRFPTVCREHCPERSCRPASETGSYLRSHPERSDRIGLRGQIPSQVCLTSSSASSSAGMPSHRMRPLPSTYARSAMRDANG